MLLISCILHLAAFILLRPRRCRLDRWEAFIECVLCVRVSNLIIVLVTLTLGPGRPASLIDSDTAVQTSPAIFLRRRGEPHDAVRTFGTCRPVQYGRPRTTSARCSTPFRPPRTPYRCRGHGTCRFRFFKSCMDPVLRLAEAKRFDVRDSGVENSFDCFVAVKGDMRGDHHVGTL